MCIRDRVNPTDELIINNTSGSSVVISQTSTARILEIFQGALRLDDVTLTGVGHNADGAGIYVHENASVIANDSIFENLDSNNRLGGAIYSEGTIELIDSIVRNNQSFGGGGIYGTNTSNLILTETDLTGNRSINVGGAILSLGDMTQNGGLVEQNLSLIHI